MGEHVNMDRYSTSQTKMICSSNGWFTRPNFTRHRNDSLYLGWPSDSEEGQCQYRVTAGESSSQCRAYRTECKTYGLHTMCSIPIRMEQNGH